MARGMALIIVSWVAATSIPAWGIFESGKELAQEAKISMAEAIRTAQATIPGKPIRAEMGKDNGHTVYQIEILDKDKKSRWVYVDTMTGAVTEAKR